MIRRNSLIHRYWVVDDAQLIANIKAGRHDFELFLEEIESYMTASAKK